jgi:hypothetical protein
MSLTSFLIDNADVRERFQQEFKKPKFLAKMDLVAPPITARYSTVGTAFDYLLRFFIQRHNPHTVSKDYWIAEQAIVSLGFDAELLVKGQEIISTARKNLDAYLNNGQMSVELIQSALSLATLDPIYRAGVGYEVIGDTYEEDVQDLKNLISGVDSGLFTAKNLCLVNPTFGFASKLVGGADADLVIDDTIIDIKTTKKLILERSAFDQILGYYILHQVSGIGELNPKPIITKVAIYFSRFSYLYVIPLSEVIDPSTFPEFIIWFQNRARSPRRAD